MRRFLVKIKAYRYDGLDESYVFDYAKEDVIGFLTHELQTVFEIREKIKSHFGLTKNQSNFTIEMMSFLGEF